MIPPLAAMLLSSCATDNLSGKSAQQIVAAAADYLASKSFHADSVATVTFDTSQIPVADFSPYLASALRETTIESHVDVKDPKDVSANEMVTEGNVTIPVWVVSVAGKSFVSSDGAKWTAGTPPSLVIGPQATDPTQQIAEASTLLTKLAANFKDLGQEQKGGLATHHLQAPVTVAVISTLLATNPALQLPGDQVNQSILMPSGAIDLWIDQASGYPLDVAITVTFQTPAGGRVAQLALGPPAAPLAGISATVPVAITNTVSLYSWGTSISVAAPSVSPGVRPPSFSEFLR